MEFEKNNKGSIFKRLKNKYRLVVMNDETFEEKFSLKLSPLALFITIGSICIVLIVLVTSVIAFTPLREYIPGYSDVTMRRQLIRIALKTDSLEQQLNEKTQFVNNFSSIINDSVPVDILNSNKPDSAKKYHRINIKPSKEDSILRSQIESADEYTLGFNEAKKGGINSFFFFSPLKGVISNSFNSEEEHFGVDIVAPDNEAIKATLDGTVILSGWTLETGYIIQVQHPNNLVSVYKHNSTLLKKVGDYVKAGEAIAIVGNTGELTTGPHLHFELWYNGNPLDPQDYMLF